MTISIIGVGGGRVTSKDESLLDRNTGELSIAKDAFYRPNDPGIHKVSGRTAFNSVAESGPIIGGRFIEFDGSTNLNVIGVGTTYRKSDAGITGTFSDLVTGLTAFTTLDSLHFDNAHYMLDGVNRSRVVASDGTTTLHGMLENTEAPTIGRDDGAGTGFTLGTGNTIVYWVEERVKDGDTILRRSGDNGTTTATLTGDGTLDKPVITHLTAVNSDATHWALMGTATNGTFPTGAEIAEVVIATTTIEDTRTGTDPGLPAGTAYEVVSVAISGITQNVARNGPPPIAKTGDILEDSLVLNDSTDASLMRYSFVDEPHKFPAVNFIRFETKATDIIQLIRTVGNIIIVCLRDQVYRVNFLPRATDADFNRGRVKSLVRGAHGAVGPLAGDTFSFGIGELLAYVSRYGILMTDGSRWDVLTDDIDWENTVEVSQLSKSVLINNPKDYRLEFYYVPKGGVDDMSIAYLHYHPSQIKVRKVANSVDLRVKSTWPISAVARTAWRANLSGIDRIFTGNSDGVVYLENEGNTDASTAGGIDYQVRTGDVQLAGPGQQAKVEKVWAHHSAHANRDATGRLVMRNEGASDVSPTWTVPLTFRESSHAQKQGQGESFQFGFENDDTSGSVRLDYFVVEDDQRGATEEG